MAGYDNTPTGLLPGGTSAQDHSHMSASQLAALQVAARQNSINGQKLIAADVTKVVGVNAVDPGTTPGTVSGTTSDSSGVTKVCRSCLSCRRPLWCCRTM
jgi:hypothetical protein